VSSFFKSDPGKKKNLGIPTVDGRIIQTLIHTATPRTANINDINFIGSLSYTQLTLPTKSIE
jgi:hypothetical protein